MKVTEGSGCFGADLIQIEECSSLFDVVATYVQEERRDILRHGTVFCARQQTAGRGRRGHHWISQEDKSLLMLLLLEQKELRLDTDKQGTLTLKAALAVSRFAESVLFAESALKAGTAKPKTGTAKRNVCIKWPNDIFVSDKKIAGILLEKKRHYCLVGIGVNVGALSWQEHHTELRREATSFQEEGVQIELAHARELLCTCLETQIAASAEKTIEEVNQVLWKKNQTVLFRYGSHTFHAVMRAVENTGAVVLEQEGRRQSYKSGEIAELS